MELSGVLALLHLAELPQQQLLVDNVLHCLVPAPDCDRQVDLFAREQGQVHVEVVPQLGLAEQVAVQEVSVLLTGDIFDQFGVEDPFVDVDDGGECPT